MLSVATLFSNIIIAANGSAYTTSVSILGGVGYCSLFVQSNYSSTSGTISIVYELSHDNINWSQVTTLSSLLTGFIKTSGPASDGKTFLYFNPPLAAYIRFKVTETAATNPVQVTLVFGYA